MTLSIDQIKSLPYCDFVGLINQWNVPPGSLVTVSKWANYSRLDHSSSLLEIACTTGFSSRELSLLSGCKATGVDLSSYAIASAKQNAFEHARRSKLDYLCTDIFQYSPSCKYSHIVIGAAARFFPDPSKLLGKCLELIEDQGLILAAPFYVHSPIPDSLVAKFQKTFGFVPTCDDYKTIMNLYSGLEVLYEDRNSLIPESESELQHYCKSTVDRAVAALEIQSESIRAAIYDRLYSIKQMSNELRPFQQYSVCVFRYRQNIYPRRYVELF